MLLVAAAQILPVLAPTARVATTPIGRVVREHSTVLSALLPLSYPIPRSPDPPLLVKWYVVRETGPNLRFSPSAPGERSGPRGSGDPEKASDRFQMKEPAFGRGP